MIHPPIKSNGKASLDDGGNEFGGGEDRSFGCLLPLLLYLPQSVLLYGLNQEALTEVILLQGSTQADTQTITGTQGDTHTVPQGPSYTSTQADTDYHRDSGRHTHCTSGTLIHINTSRHTDYHRDSGRHTHCTSGTLIHINTSRHRLSQGLRETHTLYLRDPHTHQHKQTHRLSQGLRETHTLYLRDPHTHQHKQTQTITGTQGDTHTVPQGPSYTSTQVDTDYHRDSGRHTHCTSGTLMHPLDKETSLTEPNAADRTPYGLHNFPQSKIENLLLLWKNKQTNNNNKQTRMISSGAPQKK